jgi:CHAT domain-containing protein
VAPAGLGRDLGRLVIVPDDAIATVPFAALIDERGRFVLQDHVVEITPSATLFVHANERQRSLSRDGVGSALVLADPTVDSDLFPGLTRLPGAVKELEVAGLYRRATRLTGRDATRDALFMALGEHSVVHLATHALVDDALPSRSALAMAPKRRGDGSGALYADEIPALTLPRTRTVVLAACGGTGGPLAGTAGRLSLARSFLAADVPEVVAALWPVGDQSSVSLLTALHEGLSTGHDAATALRSAQLQMLTSRDPVLRSPATWALFQALGG